MKFKMRKDHKDMFIDALNSGDYEKVQGEYIEQIEGANGKPCMCAAGVYLAQLNDLDDLIDAREEGMSGIDFGDFHRYKENTTNEDSSDSLINHIIDMNDTLNMSFESIADWIEENVEEISK